MCVTGLLLTRKIHDARATGCSNRDGAYDLQTLAYICGLVSRAALMSLEPPTLLSWMFYNCTSPLVSALHMVFLAGLSFPSGPFWVFAFRCRRGQWPDGLAFATYTEQWIVDTLVLLQHCAFPPIFRWLRFSRPAHVAALRHLLSTTPSCLIPLLVSF